MLYRQQIDRFKESQPSRVPRVAAAMASFAGAMKRAYVSQRWRNFGAMVPAQPLSKRSRNFGTILRRRRCLDGASNFGQEKSLDKAKARQAPSFHLSGWRGFYLRQNQIFRASSFCSDGPSWPPYRTIDLDGPQCMPFILRCRSARACNEDGDAGPLGTVPC